VRDRGSAAATGSYATAPNPGGTSGNGRRPRQRKPGLGEGVMAEPASSLAILFADISGSTRLYETLGDAAAKRRVADCIALLTEVVRRHRGEVIRIIGDEVLGTFPEADAAAEAARTMHETLASRAQFEREPLAVRVGLHYGPVLVDPPEIYGDAVNVAARIAALAKAEQTLTSRQTIDAVRPEHRARARYVDRTLLRGKLGELDLYEIIWREEEVTRAGRDFVPAAVPRARLTLRCQGTELTVDLERPDATFGRGRGSDLVVNDDFVSRLHARIEYRQGKFLLSDQSTNGTFIRTHGGRQVYLRRDQVQLEGSGVISLGREIDPQSPLLISFHCQA
jgi:adenylate cyclase